MKKTIAIAMLSLLVVLSMVSGVLAKTCEQTVVGGTVYQNDVTNGIEDATVKVTCEGNEQTTTSGSNGEYSVAFTCGQCTLGDTVTVSAQKDDLAGFENGSVTMVYNLPCAKLNVGIVNVPLVPEFGLIAGMVTIFGAFGLFLFVRRK